MRLNTNGCRKDIRPFRQILTYRSTTMTKDTVNAIEQDGERALDDLELEAVSGGAIEPPDPCFRFLNPQPLPPG
jgi:hypothetical protein